MAQLLQPPHIIWMRVTCRKGREKSSDGLGSLALCQPWRANLHVLTWKNKSHVCSKPLLNCVFISCHEVKPNSIWYSTFVSLHLGLRNSWVPCKPLGDNGEPRLGPLAEIPSYPANSVCGCWAVFCVICEGTSRGICLRPGLGKLCGPWTGHLSCKQKSCWNTVAAHFFRCCLWLLLSCNSRVKIVPR